MSMPVCVHVLWCSLASLAKPHHLCLGMLMAVCVCLQTHGSPMNMLHTLLPLAALLCLHTKFDVGSTLTSHACLPQKSQFRPLGILFLTLLMGSVLDTTLPLHPV